MIWLLLFLLWLLVYFADWHYVIGVFVQTDDCRIYFSVCLCTFFPCYVAISHQQNDADVNAGSRNFSKLFITLAISQKINTYIHKWAKRECWQEKVPKSNFPFFSPSNKYNELEPFYCVNKKKNKKKKGKNQAVNKNNNKNESNKG